MKVAAGGKVAQPPEHLGVAWRTLSLGGSRERGGPRFMVSFLFGVETWDPTVFVMAPFVLSAVAFLAAWIPARRASRVDPVIALRAE